MQTYYFKEFDVWLPYPEEWKPIKDFEGLYEISNYGRVKSLAKSWISANGGIQTKNITPLKANIDSRGYYHVILAKNSINISYNIHHLVWDHFGDKKRNKQKIEIDHKDNIKTHNWISNLQLLTHRQNTTKYFASQKSSSKYIGVTWSKYAKKWQVAINIKAKINHLGYFINEIDASNEYQRALEEFNKTGNITRKIKIQSSKYKGVCWSKHNKKWRAKIYINKSPKHLGYFHKEIDAHKAYQDKLREIE